MFLKCNYVYIRLWEQKADIDRWENTFSAIFGAQGLCAGF